MSKIITIYATKGGVGKSCISGNLAGCLADMGQRVLMIDTDPQQTLSYFYEIDHQNIADKTLTDLITSLDPSDCISKTMIAGLDLVAINDDSKSLSTWIKQSATRATALRVALSKIRDSYDYIIIDTEGRDGSGDLQELAVRSADIILMPINPDAVVAREFHRGLKTLDLMRPLDPSDVYNQIPRPHVFIYKYDVRSRTHKAYIEGLRGQFDELEKQNLVIPLNTQIPQVVAYNDAQSVAVKMPVHRMDHKPRNGGTPSAYDSQVELVHELLPELKTIKPRISDNDPIIYSDERGTSHG